MSSPEGKGKEGEPMQERAVISKAPAGTAEAEVLDLVEAKMKENPALQYHHALKLVASENPDLDVRYTRETRGKLVGRE